MSAAVKKYLCFASFQSLQYVLMSLNTFSFNFSNQFKGFRDSCWLFCSDVLKLRTRLLGHGLKTSVPGGQTAEEDKIKSCGLENTQPQVPRNIAARTSKGAAPTRSSIAGNSGATVRATMPQKKSSNKIADRLGDVDLKTHEWAWSHKKKEGLF